MWYCIVSCGIVSYHVILCDNTIFALNPYSWVAMVTIAMYFSTKKCSIVNTARPVGMVE